MNVLLIGNGFDLYYKLPTKYSNFLHVAEYLVNHSYASAKTIGDILSQEVLQKNDDFIKLCYDTHKTVFDNILFDKTKIEEMVTTVKGNMWFSFLLKSYNKDVGWIDFEKEIAFVLSCFEKGLPQNKTSITFKAQKNSVRYVINAMNFLIDEAATKKAVTIGSQEIKKEYCTEYPLGSGCISVDKERVISVLHKDLLALSKALKLYLQIFVESTYDLLHKDGTCRRINVFNNVNTAISFNYTSTYERLYFNKSAFHIHGRLADEIVLGVNPDDSDILQSIDTSFIRFKKYFQRTLYETDHDYLRWLSDIKNIKQTYRLIIMGHSLDVTDKDIIYDLFDNANEIIVLYHNSEAKGSYISNLVRLFGREDFEALKRNKSLTFLSLDTNLTELAQKMEKEAFEHVITETERVIV